jgi:DNA-binding transcriptional MerR regulator
MHVRARPGLNVRDPDGKRDRRKDRPRLASEEGMTVAQLADRLASPSLGGPYDRDRILRQLRHWTTSGLLQPIGGLHPGIGRHRRYSSENILIAAILIELANLGLQVGTLESVVEMLDEVASKPISDWKDKLREGTQYLRFTFEQLAQYGYDYPTGAQCVVEGVVLPPSFAETRGSIGTCSVVIDLGRLIDRITSD